MPSGVYLISRQAIKIVRLVVQLAFVTTTSESFKQIKLWIDYHKSIGVNHFYLFVDGQVRARSWPVLGCFTAAVVLCKYADQLHVLL